MDYLDPNKKNPVMLMNNLGNHILNTGRASHNIRDRNLGQSPD